MDVVKHSRGAKWGCRHVKNFTTGGQPDDAIAYVGESAPFWKTQFADDALTPELAAKGITNEDWDEICEELRGAKGKLGLGFSFSKKIQELNERFFSGIGCIAVYAEYGYGQKAMTVYETDVWKKKPLEPTKASFGPDPFVKTRKGAWWGSRHCHNAIVGGKTHDALAWIGEGEWGSFLTKQFVAKLDPALKSKGVTPEAWEEICELLRKGKGRFVFDATDPETGTRSLYGFSKAIELINTKYLKPLGAIGVYSEYRNGMKAMAVFDEVVWATKPE